MEFDFEYYFRVHVPLAKSQATGKLDILRIEVETRSELLMDPGVKGTPCVFCVYFKSREDVDTFRNFMMSAAVQPMRDDVAKYTNCELEWSVCEVREV